MVGPGWTTSRINISSFDSARFVDQGVPLTAGDRERWAQGLADSGGQPFHVEACKQTGCWHSVEILPDTAADAEPGSLCAWALVDLPPGLAVTSGAAIVDVHPQKGPVLVLGLMVSAKSDDHLRQFLSAVQRQEPA